MPKDAEFDEYPEARVGLVMLDVGTAWIDVFPKGSKTTDDTKQATNEWKGADETNGSSCLDTAP